MLSRFFQGSTWAGIAALLQVSKAFAPQYASVIDAVTVAAGSVAIGIDDTAKAVKAVKETKSVSK